KQFHASPFGVTANGSVLFVGERTVDDAAQLQRGIYSVGDDEIAAKVLDGDSGPVGETLSDVFGLAADEQGEVLFVACGVGPHEPGFPGGPGCAYYRTAKGAIVLVARTEEVESETNGFFFSAKGFLNQRGDVALTGSMVHDGLVEPTVFRVAA